MIARNVNAMDAAPRPRYDARMAKRNTEPSYRGGRPDECEDCGRVASSYEYVPHCHGCPHADPIESEDEPS